MSGESETQGRAPKERAQGGVHDKVIEVFRQHAGGTILDTPAGEGAVSIRLRDLGCSVVAGDVGNDFCVDGIPFLRLNLDVDLPFADGSFDLVACVEGIEHTENPYRVIREFARVLKPGGTLVISTPNVLSIRSRLRFLFASHHRRFKEIWQYGHLTPLSLRELKYAFERAGFTLKSIRANRFRGQWGPLYYPLRAIISFYTRLHHPLGAEVTTREVLDGPILIYEAHKTGEIRKSGP